jgi:ABC-type Co2+ transport system permease subunit
MYIDQLRRLRQGSMQTVAPHWALVAARICLLGLLSLPVVSSLLLAGRLVGGTYRPVLLWGAVGLWAASFIGALVFCSIRPASKRR